MNCCYVKEEQRKPRSEAPRPQGNCFSQQNAETETLTCLGDFTRICNCIHKHVEKILNQEIRFTFLREKKKQVVSGV